VGGGLRFEVEDCLAAGALGFWWVFVSNVYCLLLCFATFVCDSPSSSATFMRNALRSSSTRLRPRSMNSSKRWVKAVMRSRRSLKPKSTEGRLSAIEGASVLYGACKAPEKDEPKRLGVAGMAAMILECCDVLRGCVVERICNSRKAGVFLSSREVVKSIFGGLDKQPSGALATTERRASCRKFPSLSSLTSSCLHNYCP
jgi:hypothetical protein